MPPETSFSNGAIYTFRVVDDRDALLSEMKLELLHPRDILTMATLIAGEIQLSHPDRNCRGWSILVAAPAGKPLTSLPFSYIETYGRKATVQACATLDAPEPLSEIDGAAGWAATKPTLH